MRAAREADATLAAVISISSLARRHPLLVSVLVVAVLVGMALVGAHGQERCLEALAAACLLAELALVPLLRRLTARFRLRRALVQPVVLATRLRERPDRRLPIVRSPLRSAVRLQV